MKALSEKLKPAVVYKSGKPTHVILTIKEYEKILDALEDIEDLAYIEEIRKKKNPKYIPIEDVMKELGIEDKSGEQDDP